MTIFIIFQIQDGRKMVSDRIIYKGWLFVPVHKFTGQVHPENQYIELDEIIRQVHEKLSALE